MPIRVSIPLALDWSNPTLTDRAAKVAPLENLWAKSWPGLLCKVDFFRHSSGVPRLRNSAAASKVFRQGLAVTWAHPAGPGYRLSGCVPAKPDPVSPGQKR